jgi:glycosyltransferase involved in cell wall biosynthesis
VLDDLAAFRPHVAHCHSYFGSFPYSFLATLSRRYPTCFTPHDPRPIGTMDAVCWECPHSGTCLRCPLAERPLRLSLLFNRYLRERLWKRFVHWRSAKTLTLVTASRWLRDRLMRHELRRFACHTIPYGIDLEQFRRAPDARTRLGLPDTAPVLLYVAHAGPWQTNPRKGLKYLADAYVRQVLPEFPGALLLVAGEGLVPNHPNVRPLGFLSQEQLPLYYSAADAYVLPTLADNLPYTVLEAMACGTPVVASRVGGVPEQVDEGVTGHLVPAADARALGEAIVSILKDPGKRNAMRGAARAKVERDFNMETFIRRHEELYQRLAEQAVPERRI